jgi:hypothetical protein
LWLDTLVAEGREAIIRAARNPDAAMAGKLGEVLKLDGRPSRRTAHPLAINQFVRRAAAGMAQSYGGSIVKLVSETIRGWDARTVTGRLEAAVGRDLQYIRINGTLVGGLVGIAIHRSTRSDRRSSLPSGPFVEADSRESAAIQHWQWGNELAWLPRTMASLRHRVAALPGPGNAQETGQLSEELQQMPAGGGCRPEYDDDDDEDETIVVTGHVRALLGDIPPENVARLARCPGDRCHRHQRAPRGTRPADSAAPAAAVAEAGRSCSSTATGSRASASFATFRPKRSAGRGPARGSGASLRLSRRPAGREHRPSGALSARPRAARRRPRRPKAAIRRRSRPDPDDDRREDSRTTLDLDIKTNSALTENERDILLQDPVTDPRLDPRRARTLLGSRREVTATVTHNRQLGDVSATGNLEVARNEGRSLIGLGETLIEPLARNTRRDSAHAGLCPQRQCQRLAMVGDRQCRRLAKRDEDRQGFGARPRSRNDRTAVGRHRRRGERDSCSGFPPGEAGTTLGSARGRSTSTATGAATTSRPRRRWDGPAA